VDEIEMEYNEDLLEKALANCVFRHHRQRDKGGKVYAFHPIRVSQKLETVFEKICALLHDVVEDTNFKLDGVYEMFGEEVTNVVDCLSRRDDEKYFDYIDRVKANPTAIKVKLADLEDNMDITRGWDIPESMMKRMMKAKHMLEEV